MSFHPLSLLVALGLLFLSTASSASLEALTVPYVISDRIIGAGWTPRSVATSHNGGSLWVAEGTGVRSISLDGSEAPSYEFTGLSCVIPDRSSASRAWGTVKIGKEYFVALVDVALQSVVAQFTGLGLGIPCPVGSDSNGNAVIRSAGLLIQTVAVVNTAGVVLSRFTVPNATSISLSDVDVHGNVWLLQAPNGQNRKLVLYGYAIDGSVISVTQPNLDDLPLTYLNGFSVDSTGIAYFTLINLKQMPTWVSSTSTRGQSYSIALVSNYVDNLITLYSDTQVVVVSPGLGAFELVDLTTPTAPPSSHTIVNSPQANVFGAAKSVMYSGANPSESVLFVESLGQGYSNLVGVNPVTGALVTRCPLLTANSPNVLASNLAVDSTGDVYALSQWMEVQAFDPTQGPTRLVKGGAIFGMSVLAYDMTDNRLFIAPSTAKEVGIIDVNGTALGSIPLKQSVDSVRDARFVTNPSGNSLLLLLGRAGATAVDLEGNVVGTLSIAPYLPIALDVQATTGYTYILGWNQDLSSSTPRWCYVGVFDNSGVLTQYLAPPSTWTFAQDMRGVSVDTDSNVYATSFNYNAVAVWTASSQSVRSVLMSPRAALLSPIMAALAGKSSESWMGRAASTSSSVSAHSVVSGLSLTVALLLVAALL